MRVLLDLGDGGSDQMVRAAIYALRAAAAIAEDELRARPDLPPLYRAGLLYRQEPAEWGGVEHFDRPSVCLSRGWLDCDDAVAWRLGELWRAGERGATPRVVWPRGSVRYHAQVRRADQSIEDPCLILVRKEHLGS